MSRGHIAQTLKCLPPGALQMKLLAFRLWDGFSACNICKMAMLWPFLLHSSGSWLAALCHFAFPLHEPHIKCEEGQSSEIINFQFKCRGSKVYFFPPRSFLIASGQGSLSSYIWVKPAALAHCWHPRCHWGTRHPQASPPCFGHFLRPQAEEAM